MPRPRIWKETISNTKKLWKLGKEKSRNAYDLKTKVYGLNDLINREFLERYHVESLYPGEKKRIEMLEKSTPERLYNPFYQLKG